MLTAYRRPRKNCSHRDEGRKYRRCRCPIWVDGFLNGDEIRESLKLRDWKRAQDNPGVGGRRLHHSAAGRGDDRRGLPGLSPRCRGARLARADAVN